MSLPSISGPALASNSVPHLAERESTSVRYSLLGLTDDEQAIRSWLIEFSGKVATQRAYRKEADRFFRWCATQGKRLIDINRIDIERYRDFMANPPAEWIGPRNGQRRSAGWRPFAGPLNPVGIRYALTVLGSLYAYLCEAGYLEANPFALVKRKGPRPQKDPHKCIPLSIMRTFLDTLTALADAAHGSKQSAALERELFVVSALYWSGCRREELARLRFGDLIRNWERAGDQLEERWRWNVHGKGDKRAPIPIAPELLAAIKRYRGTILATPEFVDVHVLTRLRRRAFDDSKLSHDQVRDAVVSAARRVAQTLEETQPDHAALLKKITPHWLRHARTAHLLDAGVDPRYVQRLLRHESIQTTMTYDSTDDRLFYEAIVETKVLG